MLLTGNAHTNDIQIVVDRTEKWKMDDPHVQGLFVRVTVPSRARYKTIYAHLTPLENEILYRKWRSCAYAWAPDIYSRTKLAMTIFYVFCTHAKKSQHSKKMVTVVFVIAVNMVLPQEFIITIGKRCKYR